MEPWNRENSNILSGSGKAVGGLRHFPGAFAASIGSKELLCVTWPFRFRRFMVMGEYLVSLDAF